VTLAVFLPECRLLKQLQKSDASYSSTLVSSRAPHWGPTAHIFSGGNSPLTSVVITKDGKFIFAGSKDMILRRWNAHTGEVMLMSTSQPHEDEFLSGLHNLALSSDETRVISASHEETIRVWETSSLVVLYEFEHHKQRVESMKVISGDRVVSTDIAGMLYVWDLRSGIIHLSFKLDYAVQTFACSPDSQTLAHGGISIVTLRDLRSGETTMTLTMPREKRGKGPHRTLAPREGARMAIAFSSDGTYLLNSDWDGHIWLWLASTGTLIDVIPGPFPVSSMQNTLNQSTIILRRASMYNEGDIWIYDLGRREVTGSLRDACGGISPLDGACIINGDSTDRLVTPCSDGNLRLWQLSDVFETPVPDVGHGSGRLVDHVKFVDKGELVISISRNGTGNRALNIWDARCGKVLTGPNCTLSWCIDAIELKEQHHFLLIDSRFARVWDWTTNSIVRTWKTRGITIFSQSASTRDCEYVAVTEVELAGLL
jgi:WD40 repeat protein